MSYKLDPQPRVAAILLFVSSIAFGGCSPQNVVRARVLDVGGELEWESGKVVAIDLDEVESAVDVLNELPEIDSVRSLSLRNTRVTADTIRSLPDWPLERLDLGGTALSEAPVSRFTQLRWLSLAETKVRDHSPLKHLAQLTTLALSPWANDATLSLAPAWPQLETLHAANAKFTGAGLGDLKPQDVPQLRTLYLGDTALDDTALLQLPIHDQLERIVLSNTQVGDETAAHLSGFTGLDYINLSGTQLTDAGLMKLVTLPDLYVLDVDDSRVTLTGLQAFAERRPEVRLTHRLLTPPRTAEEEDLEWLYPKQVDDQVQGADPPSDASAKK